MSKKSRLGRSLDVLLSQTKNYATLEKESLQSGSLNLLDQGEGALFNAKGDVSQNISGHHILLIPIEKLTPGQFQPRRFFDEMALQELANSIKAQGILQPLVVRENGQGYEIVAGERRWRAAQLANLHEVPVIVRALTDREALAIAIIENIQRQDLNAIEEANALSRLLQEFNLTHQEIGDLVGRSRSAITNLLRLLELPIFIQVLLADKKIEMGHARALIPLDTYLQREISQLIVLKGLSVREAENLIKQQKRGSFEKTVALDVNILALEKKISVLLGSKVVFKHTSNGGGKILITYHSLDELDGIINKIK